MPMWPPGWLPKTRWHAPSRPDRGEEWQEAQTHTQYGGVRWWSKLPEDSHQAYAENARCSCVTMPHRRGFGSRNNIRLLKAPPIHYRGAVMPAPIRTSLHHHGRWDVSTESARAPLVREAISTPRSKATDAAGEAEQEVGHLSLSLPIPIPLHPERSLRRGAPEISPNRREPLGVEPSRESRRIRWQGRGRGRGWTAGPSS